VLGAAVKVTLSGLVSNWIDALSVPVTEYVTRHAIHGIFPDRLEMDAEVPAPVKVKVAEQSTGVAWA
jgi:hypothetical protein